MSHCVADFPSLRLEELTGVVGLGAILLGQELIEPPCDLELKVMLLDQNLGNVAEAPGPRR
jgi:hypothetical protein